MKGRLGRKLVPWALCSAIIQTGKTFASRNIVCSSMAYAQTPHGHSEERAHGAIRSRREASGNSGVYRGAKDALGSLGMIVGILEEG